MNVEEVRALRAKVLNGENLTNEELYKLLLFSNSEEPEINRENAEQSNEKGKTKVLSNGKSLLEKENKNQLGVSNIMFLATISLLMELSFLIIAASIFIK